jgi:hypothetical protein
VRGAGGGRRGGGRGRLRVPGVERGAGQVSHLGGGDGRDGVTRLHHVGVDALAVCQSLGLLGFPQGQDAQFVGRMMHLITPQSKFVTFVPGRVG